MHCTWPEYSVCSNSGDGNKREIEWHAITPIHRKKRERERWIEKYCRMKKVNRILFVNTASVVVGGADDNTVLSFTEWRYLIFFRLFYYRYLTLVFHYCLSVLSDCISLASLLRLLYGISCQRIANNFHSSRSCLCVRNTIYHFIDRRTVICDVFMSWEDNSIQYVDVHSTE